VEDYYLDHIVRKRNHRRVLLAFGGQFYDNDNRLPSYITVKKKRKFLKDKVVGKFSFIAYENPREAALKYVAKLGGTSDEEVEKLFNAKKQQVLSQLSKQSQGSGYTTLSVSSDQDTAGF
jgi:hypothetical protein